LDQLAINEFDDAAYNMAAVTATVALYRALVRKGLMPREEARQILLDAAVSRSIEAEALRQEPAERARQQWKSMTNPSKS